MNTGRASITVLFEDPFWVALYEREADGRYEACKITFGTEPRDYEVYAFLLEHWHRLRFSPSIAAGKTASAHVNPKRMQRLIKRQTESAGIGTRAQQAIKLLQEENKLARAARARDNRAAEQERRFALRTEKRREKHKGH